MRCRPSWSLSTLGPKHACDKNRRSSVTCASISVFPPHPIPSSRTTKYVVCCCCLHTKSRSDLYSVPSYIRTGATDANAFRGHRLSTQKGYTYAAYKTRNIYFLNLLDRKRRSVILRLYTWRNFSILFFTPPTQTILEKNPRKKRPDGHKIFRKINIYARSGRHCEPHPSSIK